MRDIEIEDIQTRRVDFVEVMVVCIVVIMELFDVSTLATCLPSEVCRPFCRPF